MTTFAAYEHNLPCKNPSCSSHGQPHPNCRCYGGLAKGGTVERFCDKDAKHGMNCEYFAGGGEVEDPALSVDHSAIYHGLRGLLEDTGYAGLKERDKHTDVLRDVQRQHAHMTNPSVNLAPQKSLGSKLGEQLANSNHEDAAEELSGHGLTGMVSKRNLTPILSQLSGAALQQPPDAEAFRSSVDHLHSAIKGREKLSKHIKGMFDRQEPLSDSGGAELSAHLDDLHETPSKMLDIGGSLGHYLPDHAAQLGAKAVVATAYLRSIKPGMPQNRPLDVPLPVGAGAEAAYQRQVAIANSPMLVLQHVKNGTVQPQDITTLSTIYPALHNSIMSQMGEAMIGAKAEGKEIPYQFKLGLSALLGQPLDSTMTQTSMQAIINSGSPSGASQRQAPTHPKAPAAAAKAQEKVNDLYQTPLQARETNKRQ